MAAHFTTDYTDFTENTTMFQRTRRSPDRLAIEYSQLFHNPLNPCLQSVVSIFLFRTMRVVVSAVVARGPGLVDGFAGVVPVMPPLQGSEIHGVVRTPGRRSSLACPGLAWVSPLGLKRVIWIRRGPRRP